MTFAPNYTIIPNQYIMSITTTTTKDSYVGNASSVTPYPITFKYLEGSHLSVYVDNVLISDSYYTLIGDGTAGTGSFKTSLEYAATSTVVVVLDVPFDQPTSLAETSALPAKTLEESYDRLNMQIRRVWRKVQNTLTFSTDEGGVSSQGTADNLLGFDGTGELAEIPNSKFCETANNLSDVTAATARANLGVDAAGTRFALSELTDATITNPVSGDIIEWNGSAWVNQVSGATVTASDTAPVSPDAGDLWFDSTTTQMFVYYNDGSSSQWVTVTAGSPSTDSGTVTYTPAGTGAVATTVETKLRESVSVKDFGAVGDGVTDDTAKIQLALDSSATSIYFPIGNYVLTDSLLDGTPALTSSVDDRTIFGEGIITANSTVLKALEITGDRNVCSLNIHGNSQIANAIVMKGLKPVVRDCHIKDLDGKATYSAIGVRFDFNAVDNAALAIGNTFENFQAVGDATAGNGAGMTRGIVISTTTADVTETSLIFGNRFYKIEGEEGDMIAIINSTGGTYYDLPVVIQNNTFDLFTRRGVKVQANKAHIISNYFSNNRGADVTSLQRAVDLVQGGDHVVKGNTFANCKYSGQIACVLDASEAKDNIIISDNLIYGIGAETIDTIIALQSYGNDCAVTNNTIIAPNFTGTALYLPYNINPTVANNVFELAFSATRFNLTGTTNLDFHGSKFDADNVSIGDPTLGSDSALLTLANSSNPTLSFYNSDTTVSDGVAVASIDVWQNDASNPDTVGASISALGQGSTGFLKWQFSTRLDDPSLEIDGSSVSGNTRLLVYDVDAASLQRVTVGSADSGGTGFKLLRIPN